MLTELRIENFKSFELMQSITLKPITLFYGQNSSGKSSILQALLSLAEPRVGREATVLGPFFDNPRLHLGGFDNVVHNGDKNRVITLGYSSKMPHLPDIGPMGVDLEIIPRPNLDGRADRLDTRTQAVVLLPTSGRKFRFDVDYPSTAEYVKFLESIVSDSSDSDRIPGPRGIPSGEVNIRELFTELLRSYLRRGDVENRFLNRALPSSVYLDFDQEAELGFDTGPVKFISLGTSGDYDLQDVNMPLLSLVAISNVKYIGPIRETPRRVFLASGANVLPGATRDHGYNYIEWLRNSMVLDRVNTWLPRLQLNYHLSVTEFGSSRSGPIYSLDVTDLETQVVVSACDVGYGLSQILPILVKGAHCGLGGQTICVEQPEIHLHPRMQGEIMDYFIETVRGVVGPTQWIIETHSEALMLRLQRRIREGKYSSDDVAVYHIGRIGGLGSLITEMPLDEQGNFSTDWPGGFFEEDFDDIFGEFRG